MDFSQLLETSGWNHGLDPGFHPGLSGLLGMKNEVQFFWGRSEDSDLRLWEKKGCRGEAQGVQTTRKSSPIFFCIEKFPIALKGRHITAWGEAPGIVRETNLALKGRA